MSFNKQHFLIIFIFFFSNTTISQTLAYISPKQNETNVPINSNIIFGFDLQPDSSYENNETIFIYGSQTGRKMGCFEILDSGSLIKFTPDTQFNPGEIITVIISQNLRFVNGQLLHKPLIWQFYIEALRGDSQFIEGQTFEIIQNQQESIESSDVCGIDIDGNNSIEIFIPDMKTKEYGIFGLSNGQYYQKTSFSLGSGYPVSLMPVDLNMDYKIDLLIFASGAAQSWINAGDFTFMQVSSIKNMTTSSILTDFNGDGDFDIATLNAYENKLEILMNNGKGVFNYNSDIQVGSWPMSITTGDFDNDFDMDIAISDGAHILTVLKNDGLGNFSYNQELNDVGYNLSINSCDLNKDGYIDIAAANKNDKTVTIFINDKKGSFIKYDCINTNYTLSYLNFSDFNADGNIDIIVAGSLGSYILINKGDGAFELGQNLIRGDFIIVGDYDMDGDIDLGLSSKYNDELQLYKNNNFPETFNLVSPFDSERLDNLDDFIHFSWDESIDLDNDSIEYSLKIFNSTIDTTIMGISEEYYNFNWLNNLNFDEIYNWTAIANDEFSQTASLDTFQFQIYVLNNRPKNFNLINPPNNESIQYSSKYINFIWEDSYDLDNDSLKYNLQIYNSSKNISIENISNNFYDLFWKEIIVPEEKYYWTVSVSDSYFNISSADTFSFIIKLPKEFIAYQNYPNPFKRSTYISYIAPSSGHVKVNIFDLQGKLLATLVDKFVQIGHYEIEFYADGFASGLYLCRIQFNDIIKIKKMLLIK